MQQAVTKLLDKSKRFQVQARIVEYILYNKHSLDKEFTALCISASMQIQKVMNTVCYYYLVIKNICLTNLNKHVYMNSSIIHLCLFL